MLGNKCLYYNDKKWKVIMTNMETLNFWSHLFSQMKFKNIFFTYKSMADSLEYLIWCVFTQ